MTFRLPLATRQRLAADKRRRYWADPAERLKRINEARAFRGATPHGSLADIETGAAVAARRARDSLGRFAR